MLTFGTLQSLRLCLDSRCYRIPLPLSVGLVIDILVWTFIYWVLKIPQSHGDVGSLSYLSSLIVINNGRFLFPSVGYSATLVGLVEC